MKEIHFYLDINYMHIKDCYYAYDETEDGFVSTNELYIWPRAVGVWNIAISGREYEEYVNSLLKIALI